MSMKICSRCGKNLSRRKRLVNADKNSMRCRDCLEPDVISVPETPQIAEGPVGGEVAKPNYVTKKRPKQRNTQPVVPVINGEVAKDKHYISTKKKKTITYPVIDEKNVKKHEKGKSNA